MKLLLDEMYKPAIAEQLRNLGHDVYSVHEADMKHLEGVDDEVVFRGAVASGRAIVTDNVADFAALESAALGMGETSPGFVYTSNGRFPRGDPRTTGKLVRALDALLSEHETLTTSVFLRPDG